MMKVEILWMNGVSVVEAVFMNLGFEVELGGSYVHESGLRGRTRRSYR